MVSGLVTSPWDHERIFSGLARLMRMESKSAIKLARSYGLLPFHQLDVQAERLQLADEHVERLGHAGFDTRFALDDGLVDFRAAIDVVGLRREQLLQDVRCAVSLERPDFHFAEALAAELRLAAERLLRDERVRADAARVNLVVDKMR